MMRCALHGLALLLLLCSRAHAATECAFEYAAHARLTGAAAPPAPLRALAGADPQRGAVVLLLALAEAAQAQRWTEALTLRDQLGREESALTQGLTRVVQCTIRGQGAQVEHKRAASREVLLRFYAEHRALIGAHTPPPPALPLLGAPTPEPVLDLTERTSAPPPPRPWYRRPAVWGTAGGVLAVGAVVIPLVLVLRPHPPTLDLREPR